MSDPFDATPPTSPPSAAGAAPPRDPRLGAVAAESLRRPEAEHAPQQPQPDRIQPPAQPSETPPSIPLNIPGQPASPEVRRTAAIVITSLGALLLTAAATVFMVIAWERLRLPGKVGVVGFASAGALFAGHSLKDRLPGVAAVLTHLGAVLAPLVAGAGAVALEADRPTVAVAGGVVGLAVLQGFDRMRSPVLATGRALAAAGIAVGLGVWFGFSPALILLAVAATAALLDRWDESVTAALLAASTPLIGWGATIAEAGSLLPWLDELSVMDEWVTALVGIGSLIVITGQLVSLPSPRLGTFRAQWSALVATAVFAINTTAFADTALAHPDAILLGLAVTALVARTIERLWVPMIGLAVDATTWLVTGLVWLSLLSVEAFGEAQRTEMVAAVLLLTSWLLADAFGPEASPTSWHARVVHGAAGPMSSIGVVLTGSALALASADATNATIGLVVLSGLFALSARANRSELAMVSTSAALIASASAPMFLPLVSVTAIGAATIVMIADLRRGVGPRSLQPLQLFSLAIAGAAMLLEPAIAEPTWWGTSLHLGALGLSAVALSRFSRVPDLLLAPRVTAATPIFAAIGEPQLAGIAAVVAGVALLIDHGVHGVRESRWIGLGLATIGSWLLAADAGVTAPEAYIALPCLILAAFGYDIVRRGGSSWLGMAPAVAIFTFIGVAERLDGGGGWHAVGAGTVAILALMIGVDRRWAGPSLTGLVALLGVVGIETSAYVPQVPLWIWLAVGGAALVGAGVHLERSADGEGTATLRAAWASFR